MGKPTWVEGGGRRSATTFLGMDSPEPTEPQFPRRWPRTGTAFQCKGIPEVQEKYVSSRPDAPVLMSADIPYRTIIEVEALEERATCNFNDGRGFNLASTDDTALAGAKGKRTEQGLDHSCVVF